MPKTICSIDDGYEIALFCTDEKGDEYDVPHFHIIRRLGYKLDNGDDWVNVTAIRLDKPQYLTEFDRLLPKALAEKVAKAMRDDHVRVSGTVWDVCADAWDMCIFIDVDGQRKDHARIIGNNMPDYMDLPHIVGEYREDDIIAKFLKEGDSYSIRGSIGGIGRVAGHGYARVCADTWVKAIWDKDKRRDVRKKLHAIAKTIDAENAKAWHSRIDKARRNQVLGGILGFCVGDALGVPVEFMSRDELEQNPVTDMRGFGSHDQPPGTWSEDTSMNLCAMDSLKNGLDYFDMMSKLRAWYFEAIYTPHREVFDIGISTQKAIERFSIGTEPLSCGGDSEYDNGNGSLMRILPLAFYLISRFGMAFYRYNLNAFNIIHDVSSLTHAHKRSHIACGLYVAVAGGLCDGVSKKIKDAYDGLHSARRYYESKAEYHDELAHFKRLFDSNFAKLPQEQIKSTGYAVDTLEAALWCLMNSHGYEECVLKAVNLGGDTDTIAALAGGLAGILYGRDAIPTKWLGKIVRLDYVQKICDDFAQSLTEKRGGAIT